MKPLRALVVGTLCAALSTGRLTAQGIQWPRGDRLTVNVAPDSLTLLGGAGLHIRYRVANDRKSEQAGQILQIEAGVPVTAMAVPNASRDWVHIASASKVYWASVAKEQDIAPGTSRSGFAIDTRGGLPGVVRFWVEGRYEIPMVTEAEAEKDTLGEPRVEDNSVTGLTVGAEAVADLTPGGLLQRLSGLNARACELGWITNAGVCHSLQVKLEQATASLARGNRQAARGQLQAFVQELTAQRGPEPGKHVSENAYWLLKLNVEFLLAKL